MEMFGGHDLFEKRSINIFTIFNQLKQTLLKGLIYEENEKEKSTSIRWENDEGKVQEWKAEASTLQCSSFAAIKGRITNRSIKL